MRESIADPIYIQIRPALALIDPQCPIPFTVTYCITGCVTNAHIQSLRDRGWSSPVDMCSRNVDWLLCFCRLWPSAEQLPPLTRGIRAREKHLLLAYSCPEVSTKRRTALRVTVHVEVLPFANLLGKLTTAHPLEHDSINCEDRSSHEIEVIVPHLASWPT